MLVRDKNFPWLSRYAALIRPNPKVQKDEIVGYEIVLNFNGVPMELIPRAASEVKGKSQFQLLSVNEAEQKRNPCRKLVTRRGTHWELTTHGENLLRLLVL